MDTGKKNIGYLLVALFVAIAPRIFSLPFWMLAWIAVLWAYAFLSEKKSLPTPGKYVRATLALIGVAGVLLHFGGSASGASYVGLLAIMTGLKVLEIQTRRDEMFTIFLAYFLVITSLFQAETLAMTIYMFFSVIATTAVLIHINHPEGRFETQLKLSCVIVLKAAPIMVILFFLFPRFQESFWGLRRTPLNTTGFSDTMRPGSVSSLVKNNEIAFRARFEGSMPARESLYWRGVVFWNFDGTVWSRGIESGSKLSSINGSKPVVYTVMLEPHFQKMLFSLDLPAKGPPNADILEDNILVSDYRIRNLYRYQATSYPDHFPDFSDDRLYAAKRLPQSGNSKARELARHWARKSNDPENVVEEGLKYFGENNFVYTLNPPLLRADSVDGFLFETRKGYCEHFASSFAFLMRAAGIPARVVGGYQGGEINPYGGYLIVRQSDAHAWVEVWIESKGWIRVDPTERAAPLRITEGMQNALRYEELPTYLTLDNLGPFANAWREIRFSWDALNSFWDIWFVGYSDLEQRDFFSRLGFKSGSWRQAAKTISWILCLVVAGGGLLWFLHRRGSVEKADPVAAVYRRFCAKLASAGLERKPWQGPFDFAENTVSARRDLKEPVETITELYVRLRYSPIGGDERKKALAQLKKLVAGFSPGRVGKRAAGGGR